MKWQRVILCGCITAFAACESDSSWVPQDKEVGNKIIAALEKYKAERGFYPDVLDELVPNYVPDITKPRYGEKRWDYVHRCRDDSFDLFMWGRNATDDAYLYKSKTKSWETVSNSF